MILVDGVPQHTVKEACSRLGISRLTLLRSIASGIFTDPPWAQRGMGLEVRYFPESWYETNEPRLRQLREQQRRTPNN